MLTIAASSNSSQDLVGDRAASRWFIIGGLPYDPAAAWLWGNSKPVGKS